MEGWCKTQFAGIETHIEVVEFLLEIAPFFDHFKVVDDGGYWPARDRAELERRIAVVGAAIEGIAERFPRTHKSNDHTPRSGLN